MQVSSALPRIKKLLKKADFKDANHVIKRNKP